MKGIIIAIDGFSGCGKSTTAKAVAQKLNYIFIDSGAMYRAVTYYFIQHAISLQDKIEVENALEKIHLEFNLDQVKNKAEIYLNGQNIEEQIREMNVSKLVSEVSRIPEVRYKMIAQQRQLGNFKSIVMDGRDIGTNVFKNAELKYFLSADIDIRVERRFKELIEKNIPSNKEEIKENLEKRDLIDQGRKENPLIKAEDAILMDTSHMTIDGQIDVVLQKAKELIHG